MDEYQPPAAIARGGGQHPRASDDAVIVVPHDEVFTELVEAVGVASGDGVADAIGEPGLVGEDPVAELLDGNDVGRVFGHQHPDGAGGQQGGRDGGSGRSGRGDGLQSVHAPPNESQRLRRHGHVGVTCRCDPGEHEAHRDSG